AVPGMAPGCGNSGHVLGRAAGGVSGDGSVGGADGGADSGDGKGPVDAGPACSGLGPAVMLPLASAGSACAAALTTRQHRYALCLCDSLNVSSPIYTDAMDSSGAAIGAQPPAAIGIDGDLQASKIQAFGSVTVAGPNGMTVSDRIVSL